MGEHNIWIYQHSRFSDLPVLAEVLTLPPFIANFEWNNHLVMNFQNWGRKKKQEKKKKRQKRHFICHRHYTSIQSSDSLLVCRPNGYITVIITYCMPNSQVLQSSAWPPCVCLVPLTVTLICIKICEGLSLLQTQKIISCTGQTTAYKNVTEFKFWEWAMQDHL